MTEKWIGSPLTQIDNTIDIIEFEIRRKIKMIKATEAKVELTEGEKIKVGKEYDFIRNIRSLISTVRATVKANLGQSPPAAVDLEETVLGAMILENTNLPVCEFLEADHFYNPTHRVIFSAIRELKDEGNPIDMRTVVIQLRKNGQTEVTDAHFKVAELTSKVSSAANLEYHARLIIEFAMKRRLILMASEILMEAYMDDSDCFDLIEKAESQIKLLARWRRK